MKTSPVIILSMALLFASCGESKKMKAGYEGEDISGSAEIIRDKNTKEASLRIDTDGKWRLYSGSSDETIELSTPVAKGKGGGLFTVSVPGDTRSYFRLVTDKGSAILAERHLPMAGGYNFRDLGGFRTKEGRYVKWGKIFRSDDLHNLTDADLAYLSSIPIMSVVDFRSDGEVAAAPDKLPAGAVSYPYHISPGNITGVFGDFSGIDPDAVDSLMMDINIMIVTDSLYVKRYRDFFTLLQNEDRVPLLFHCSAGKDRTGMGAALVLFALGVDEETIMGDYISSNTYLGDKYGQYTARYPELKAFFEVKPEFIGAGLERIRKDHGSIENYISGTLGVDIEKFREMYLY